jgi:hypothetical protein
MKRIAGSAVERVSLQSYSGLGVIALVGAEDMPSTAPEHPSASDHPQSRLSGASIDASAQQYCYQVSQCKLPE